MAAAKSSRRHSWRERWITLRNKLLMSPSFQRWAPGFPLTRATANRKAAELFDLCAGFVYSQVLLTTVRLELLEQLATQPYDAAALAKIHGMPLDSMQRLLRAAASLKLAEELEEDVFMLGERGASLLANPGIAEMIEHHEMLYADLADPVELLKGGRRDTNLSRYWAYARAEDPKTLDRQAVDSYSQLMAASQGLVAQDILAAYPFQKHKTLMDVGGGHGAFLLAAAKTAPNLDLRLFDLPAVAEAAQQRFDEAGLGARAEAIGGDFFSDPLPKGADVISFVRILHDHDDDAVLALLTAANAALPRDGALIVAEPTADAPGAERVGDAYFNFYLYAMGSGRARRREEIDNLLSTAGFGRVTWKTTRRPLLTRLAVARPD